MSVLKFPFELLWIDLTLLSFLSPMAEKHSTSIWLNIKLAVCKYDFIHIVQTCTHINMYMHIIYCTCKAIKSTVYRFPGKVDFVIFAGFSAVLISTDYKEMMLKGLHHSISIFFLWPAAKLAWNWSKPENNASQRWKNTKDNNTCKP